MGDFLSEIWGSIPEVAEYTPTDLGEEQLKAIMENISAFPEISQLGSLFQEYMTGAYEKAIPGFSDILAGGGKLTKQMMEQAAPLLRGEIPADVLGQITRSGAFRALQGGYAGSGMDFAGKARDIGETSLGLIFKGAQLAGQAGNAAQRWMGMAQNLIMNPSGMLVTPQQQAALTMQNNLYKQATQQRKFNMEAMPDPAVRGIHDTVINLIGAYLGKGGGGSTAPPVQQYNGLDYYGEGSDVSNALGPSMESAWAGTDDYGNYIDTSKDF